MASVFKYDTIVAPITYNLFFAIDLLFTKNDFEGQNCINKFLVSLNIPILQKNSKNYKYLLEKIPKNLKWFKNMKKMQQANIIDP